MPTHNRAQWERKFARNRERDQMAHSKLSDLGLRVLTVWECETKSESDLRIMLSAHVLGQSQVR